MNITFDTFNLKSPYTRFDKASIPQNVEIKNWQYPDSVPTFNDFVARFKPDIIIELGSWLGCSAVEMAKACKHNNLGTKILCVDTWLGSVEHWRRDKCDSMGEFDYFANGTSAMFDTFCCNVLSNGAEDYIIPLPNTTTTMFKLFQHLGITSQMIYVDASHEKKDVLEDLTSYYTILEEGGVIFGDDVCWPDVISAATEFAAAVNRPVNLTPNKNLFYIVK